MKPQFYLFLLCCLFPIILAAQPGSACGFEPDPAAIQWMNQQREAIARFQADPASRNRLREVKRVPLRFVAFNEGKTAGLSQTDINEALSTLNKQFLPAGIEFFSCHPPVNVLFSEYARFDRTEEHKLWDAYKTPGAINIFCTESITFNLSPVAGYTYLPMQNRAIEGIFIVRSSLNTTTLTHEMGHYFGLYHTHGKSNCEETTDELVNDPNCEQTGDEVCDTPADPNLSGIDCSTSLVDPTCRYFGTLRDAKGELYQPDPNNIMSYSLYKCEPHLTPGQYARIQYFSQFRVYPEECPAESCFAPVITIDDTTYTTFKISWSVLSTDSLYELRYRFRGQSNWLLRELGTNTWSLSEMSPCTQIEVQVRRKCPNGFSNWSTTQLVKTQGCPGTYCANYGGKDNVWINRLQVFNWTNTSGDNKGYKLELFSGLKIRPGDRFNAQLEPGGSIRTRDTMYWQVWIDLNRDKVFSDQEKIYQGTSVQRSVHNGVFILPQNLEDGLTRMRVILSRGKFVQACGLDPAVMEVEDHEVYLIVPISSCPTPLAANFYFEEIQSYSARIKYASATNAQYRWRIREEEVREWQRDTLIVDSVLHLQNLKPSTFYVLQLQLQCVGNVSSGFSDQYTFKTLPAPCLPPDVSSLQVSQITSSSAFLTCDWIFGALAYEFSYRPKGADQWIVAGQYEAPEFLLNDLLNDAQYEFRVRALCSVDPLTFGAYSQSKSFQTLLNICAAPQASEMELVLGSNNTLRLTSYLSAKSYSWRWRNRGALAWTDSLSSPLATLNIGPLDIAQVYEFQARIQCTDGSRSTWSSTLTVMTHSTACASPDLNSLVLGYRSSTQEVTYRYLGPAYQEIQWRYKAVMDSAWIELPGQEGSLNNLGTDGPYEFSARGLCFSGELSDWSKAKPFIKPCTPLTAADLIIEYRGNGSVLFETNVQAKKYFWRYRIKGAANWSPTIEREFGVLLLEQLKSDALYEFGLRIQCFNETIGNWLTVEYQMPCVKPVATDLSVSTTLERVTITYNKDNFTKLDWRYRIVGDTNTWRYDGYVSYKQLILNQLKPGTLYEAQVRKQCIGEIDWTDWTASITFRSRLCQLPDSIHLSPFYTNTGQLYLLAENSKTPWRVNDFLWRYRKLGDAVWLDTIKTHENVVTIRGLVPGATYEVELEMLCTENGNNKVSFKGVFTLPIECFVFEKEKIQLSKITISTAQVHVNARDKINYKIRYRNEGATEYTYRTGSTFYPSVLYRLKPGTKYELGISVICKQKEEWSEPIYFKTPACDLPYGGEISALKIGPDSTSLALEFFEFAAPLENLDYQWKYRPKGQTNWAFLPKNNQSQVLLTGLTPSLEYEVVAHVACPNSAKDSLMISSQFKAVLDSCSQRPLRQSWLETFQDTINSNVHLSCNFGKSGYQVEVRFRDKSNVQNFWRTVPSLISCDKSSLVYFLEPGTTDEFQFRVICPSGNVGPWSAIFQMERGKPVIEAPAPEKENKFINVLGKPLARKLTIFPNPGPGRFSIQSSVELSGPGTLSIYGSDGRQVLHRSLENASGSSLDIDLSEHPAGLYFVRLQAGKVGYTEKILLQKP